MAGQIAMAAAGGICDILRLPELCEHPTQGTRMIGFTECMGVPVSPWLQRSTERLRIGMVATVAIQVKDRTITNTGLAFEKTARMAGCYDKVHLPEGERDSAALGHSFPVFELDG